MTEQDKARCTCGAPPDSIHEPICDLLNAHPDLADEARAGFEGIERKLETLREQGQAERHEAGVYEASLVAGVEPYQPTVSNTTAAPDTAAEAGEWHRRGEWPCRCADGKHKNNDALLTLEELNALTARLREAEAELEATYTNMRGLVDANKDRAAAAEQRAERLEQALRSLETVTRSHARHGAGLEPGYDCDDLIAYCDVAAAALKEDA